MPRKATVLNSLTRGRIRTSWNKYNLFNLYKKSRVEFKGKSLYQQKWTAKTETRAYHGEHLTESRWQATFSPKLEGVAQLDASLKGEGNITTPMPLQTFAILEKRLDFALFRSLFASSVRQARQFILQGNVLVNGVKIKHPSYELKAGDVFSVNPEKVMEALGKPKPSVSHALKVDNYQTLRWNQYVLSAKADPKATWERKNSRVFKKIDGDSNEVTRQKIAAFNNSVLKEMLQTQQKISRNSILKDIIKLSTSVETPEVKNFEPEFEALAERCFKIYELLSKHELITNAKTYSSSDLSSKISDFIANKDEKENETTVKKVKQLLSEINSKYLDQIRQTYEKKMVSEDSKTLPYDPNYIKGLRFHPKLDKEAILEDESKAVVNLPWQKHLYGRKDPSKPYFTPFTPRGFLAPFAILPSHLEISFETCHAVYLRNPIARPGQSEVISPFAIPVHERAYMYYVKRGK